MKFDSRGKVEDGKDGDGNLKKEAAFFLVSFLSQQSKTCICAVVILIT